MIKLSSPLWESPTLIVDSWTGYNQAKNVFREQVRFKTVPKKCTNLAQPLDIYFNRQFKAFYRRLSETVIREDEGFIVSQRANAGRLLNLTFAQFSAPRFQPMLKYAWHAAGLLEERPPSFVTPEKFISSLPPALCALPMSSPVARFASAFSAAPTLYLRDIIVSFIMY